MNILKQFSRLSPPLFMQYTSLSFTKQCWSLLSPQNRQSHSYILGIETSCDDTGAAIVDSVGNVIGESLHSQLVTHLNLGGIIPTIARDLHKQNIAMVVQTALNNAGMEVSDVDAVAVTCKPGMPLSLLVGLAYAKNLCSKWNKPLIPIHHMEAHALTVRMVENVSFPFMVLLVSGGHCLLAIANNVDEFLLLGQSVDNAPGEVLDKAARRLKLRNIPAFSAMSGGRALAELAKNGDIKAYDFGHYPMYQHRDCSFSFAGLRNKIIKLAETEEEKHGIEGGQVLPPNVLSDICASFQYAAFSHICKRLHRAIIFADINGLLPTESRKLVVSGGVACNSYLRECLGIMCDQMDYTLVCPPPKLCTDNGIMIAWNGMEKWKAGIGIADSLDSVDIEPKAPLGKDISEEVRKNHIALKKIKLHKYQQRVNKTTD